MTYDVENPSIGWFVFVLFLHILVDVGCRFR